ncbi:MAG TPA: TonB-dependent receptor [Nitrospiria bacterium]|nr:TonB-dependent receptor [Nitrospiria bacterium]
MITKHMAVLTLLFLLAFNLEARAQGTMPEVEVGEIVITATKTETPLKDVASSVTIIKEEDIDKKKAKTVAEAIRDVPGIDVVQTGGPGGLTSVFIRGGNSNHTLVLIDGVQVNSPTAGLFDFANLTTDNIERIEIVRGAQSTLYGSDAIGGVINIITKRGKGAPAINFSVEAGSFRSLRESIGISGTTQSSDYSLSVGRFDTDGFSSANEKNGNTEKDGYENTTISSRLGWNSFTSGRLELSMRYSDAEADQDGFTFSPIDDPNFVQKDRSMNLSTRYSRPLTNWWNQHLQLSMNVEELKGIDPDPADIFNNFEFDTQRRLVEWQHQLYIAETDIMTIGYEYEGQNGKVKDSFDRTITNSALYIQDQHQISDAFSQAVGVRADYNNRFGNEITYKAEASYRIKESNTRFRAAYGTGFHGPTLNDLYFPGFGNPDLKPETSESIEGGIEQTFLSDRLSLQATYFYNRFENLIIFDSTTFLPENIGEATSKGAEIGLQIRPFKAVTLSTNYTLTDTENRENDKELPRRPRKKASAILSISPIAPLNIDLELRYVGKRFDDSANLNELDPYTLVNIAGRFDVTKSVQVFARVENLFDKEYEEALGFGTAGFSVFGGVKIRF